MCHFIITIIHYQHFYNKWFLRYTLVLWLAPPTLVMSQTDSHALNAGLLELWNADKNSKKRKASKKILNSGTQYDQIFHALSIGKKYPKNIPIGVLTWEYKLDSLDYTAIVHVPESYNPSIRYPLIFELHGGVGSEKKDRFNGLFRRHKADLKTRNHITVYPSSWYESKWWNESQYENLVYLINRLKQNYNIDENKIHLGGVSDGGTGTYYMANRNPTLWASYLSLIGNLSGLQVLSDNQVYISNFKFKPFLAINTQNDHIFPPNLVLPYMELINRAGVDLDFLMLKNYGHNMKWYSKLKVKIDEFQKKHERNPFPDSLYWETEDVAKKDRNHWLRIRSIGKMKAESQIGDANILNIDGIRYAAFPRDSLSGRIKLSKLNNKVFANTTGVRKFSLLISPEHFNLNEVITITVNKKIVFQSKIEKSPKTLLKWFIKDNDRTMLFASEVIVNVGKKVKISK